jgi:biopolymer transport protein ExbB
MEKTEMTLMQLWTVGGWCMWPILFLSIAAAAFAAYGFINFSERRMVHLDLVPQIMDAVRKLDIRAASAICTGSPSVMTNILNAGLMRLSGRTTSLQSVEKAMEEASVEENNNGMKPLNYISLCASLAPMFGLLGTVSGMIKAFQKIGLGAMGDPEKLANDIGEAMITTAFGLIVGIPAMFFYFHLKGQFIANMAKTGRVLGNVSHEMSEALHAAGQPEPQPAGEDNTPAR